MKMIFYEGKKGDIFKVSCICNETGFAQKIQISFESLHIIKAYFAIIDNNIRRKKNPKRF